MTYTDNESSKYCVSEGDYITGRLISKSSLSGFFRCFMRDVDYTICSLIAGSLMYTGVPLEVLPLLQAYVFRECKSGAEFIKGLYNAYKKFKEWHESLLQLLFDEWFDLDKVKLDPLIGVRRLPPSLREKYKCKIGLPEKTYYYVSGEIEKNCDLCAAIRVNTFLLFEMLYKIDQEFKNKNIVLRYLISPIKKLSEIVKAEALGYNIYIYRRQVL